jgi:anti-sigma factor RsiW
MNASRRKGLALERTMTAWIVVVLAVGLIAAGEKQDWEQADRRTRRLLPAVFVDLPAPVRSELERRGCTVPQPFTSTRPANVIKGRFTSANQTDWAVLCSRQQASSILVFRRGRGAGVVSVKWWKSVSMSSSGL